MAEQQNTIAAVAALAVQERQCYLIRYRKDSVLNGTALYDAKPYGTGSKRGWTALDITTANLIVKVFDAVQNSATISEERKAKFNNLPLGKLVAFCWSVAK